MAVSESDQQPPATRAAESPGPAFPSKRPDAVTVPRPFPAGRDGPNARIKAVFGPALGLRQYFASADPDDSLVFPTLHELASVERYDWWVVAESAGGTMLGSPELVESFRDRPEAVKFGYLRDPDEVAQPSNDQKASFLAYVQERDLKYQQMIVRYRELLVKQGHHALDAAEKEELGGIEAEIHRLAASGPQMPPGA
jgi:hypothetical protein